MIRLLNKLTRRGPKNSLVKTELGLVKTLTEITAAPIPPLPEGSLHPFFKKLLEESKKNAVDYGLAAGMSQEQITHAVEKAQQEGLEAEISKRNKER